MEHNQTKRGSYGWLAVTAFIAVFDYLSEETMTHAYKRGLEHPHARPAVIAGLGVTALHLLDVIPHQYDPFYVLSSVVDSAINRTGNNALDMVL